MAGRVPFVEHRIEGESPVAGEVAHDELLHLVHLQAVALRPHHAHIVRRQALQLAHPAASYPHRLSHHVAGEMSVGAGVLHQRIAHILAVIPGVEPALHLLILGPLLHRLPVTHHVAAQHRAVAIEQARLSVQDAGADIVALQQVAQPLGEVVQRSPGYYSYSTNIRWVLIPALAGCIQHRRELVIPSHVDGELSGAGLHE